MARIINAVKQVKKRDFLAPFIFILLLIPSLIFRLINKIKDRKLWLIAEEGQARDNGYHFYRYVRLNHPNDYCFYAIKNESAGYDKVSKLGNVIKWGSLKHWLYYMSASLNISSQKSGNPCPIFWYVLHVTFGLYKNRVFLQHGITKDDSKWIYNDKTKFKYFVCGAKREYDYILQKFGYKKDSLLLTGFPRWDNLRDISSKQSNKSILIMPTWRKWLGENRNKVFKVNDFEETDFYKEWNGLLNNEKFIEFIEQNNITVYFYPHMHMMKFLSSFKSKSKNIVMVSLEEDIQDYFNKCSLMITDYSSVAFDFAYLNKPVIYFQFDNLRYRKEQLQEGYFDYERDGFGPVCKDSGKVITSAMAMIERVAATKDESFFTYADNNNSERLYYRLKPKKRVLHVIYTLNNGGAQRYLINLLKYTNNDYENSVAYYGGNNAWKKELDEMSVDVYEVSGGNNRRLSTLRRIMKKEKIDIVYSYSFYNSVFVLIAAKMAGVKKRIVHSHQSLSTTNVNSIKKQCTRIAVSLLATDKLACSKEAGRALFIGGNIKIINNGAVLSDYYFDEQKRRKIRKNLHIADDCMVLGTIGRLDDNKNQIFMINVTKMLLDDGVKCALVIIGDGENKGKLECDIERLSLNKNVLLLGQKQNASDYYSAFDVFLLTSYSEGFPYVLVEAQANGLPIYASSSISAESKINDNVTFVSLNNNVKKWAHVIEKCDKTRINPADQVNDYSIENTVKQVEDIYEA